MRRRSMGRQRASANGRCSQNHRRGIWPKIIVRCLAHRPQLATHGVEDVERTLKSLGRHLDRRANAARSNRKGSRNASGVGFAHGDKRTSRRTAVKRTS